MVVNNVVCELSVAAVLPFVCDKRSTACLDIVIIVTITHRVKPPSTDLIWVPNKNLKKSYKDFPIFSESILWHNAEFLAWEISWSDSKIEILLIPWWADDIVPPWTPCTRHQTSHLATGFIGLPRRQLNAFANSGKFITGPFALRKRLQIKLWHGKDSHNGEKRH